jgi:ubiquinone/menaquinone biosynthesis C-methylase UbiE
MQNVDVRVADGFGQEWSTFTQGDSDLDTEERTRIFHQYFRLFPWDSLPAMAEGLDAGCGTGRWATLVAQRVGHVHLLDASFQALSVAKRNLADVGNVTFHLASVSEIPLAEQSLDFAYSLGVLHHVPDTLGALQHIASKLKPGAPLLLYLYYALDNRPAWFRIVWKLSNIGRLIISESPNWLKLLASQLIAAGVYWPLARFSTLLNRMGLSTRSIPLEAYKDRGFYTMKTDAYDRFCTSLEKRFTRPEIEQMLCEAGFDKISFSDEVPFWCAVARKAMPLK